MKVIPQLCSRRWWCATCREWLRSSAALREGTLPGTAIAPDECTWSLIDRVIHSDGEHVSTERGLTRAWRWVRDCPWFPGGCDPELPCTRPGTEWPTSRSWWSSLRQRWINQTPKTAADSLQSIQIPIDDLRTICIIYANGHFTGHLTAELLVVDDGFVSDLLQIVVDHGLVIVVHVGLVVGDQLLEVGQTFHEQGQQFDRIVTQ